MLSDSESMLNYSASEYFGPELCEVKVLLQISAPTLVPHHFNICHAEV